jgi:hypothetical protein
MSLPSTRWTCEPNAAHLSLRREQVHVRVLGQVGCHPDDLRPAFAVLEGARFKSMRSVIRLRRHAMVDGRWRGVPHVIRRHIISRHRNPGQSLSHSMDNPAIEESGNPDGSGTRTADASARFGLFGGEVTHRPLGARSCQGGVTWSSS